MAGLAQIIDVHSHPILPYGQGAPVGLGQKQPDWSVEGAISYMDEHDISACVLSDPDSAQSCNGARSGRHRQARQRNARRHRFQATQPVWAGRDAAGSGCRRGRDRDRLCARHIEDGRGQHFNEHQRCLSRRSRNSIPWFEELNRRGATLFVHPTFTKATQTLLIGLNPSGARVHVRYHSHDCQHGRYRRQETLLKHQDHLNPRRRHHPYLVNRIQTLSNAIGVGPGRLELSPQEVREGIASFYYDLTAATSEAQLGAILKLVPVSQLVMGLDFPLMPKSTFAPAIADIGRYPAFSKSHLQSLSYGNAGRLYPALKARIERRHRAQRLWINFGSRRHSAVARVARRDVSRRSEA